MKANNSWLLIAACSMMLASCEKNNADTPSEALVGGEGKVLIETTVKNTDGASGQSYLQQIPELTGTLDMTGGIQIGFSATISTVGNDVYVFPEFGTNSKHTVDKYVRTEKGLKAAGALQIIPNSYPVNLTQVSEDKAYIPMYNLGKVMVVNPKTMELKSQIDLSSYAYNDSSADPAYGIIVDGLYYLPLDQIGPNWMPYDDHRQVDVAVIDTATDKVLKVISETKSGLCFPTRPFLENMIFQTEDKDIYMACTGYFGYNPEYVKNGFACISAATKEFDESKCWDISGTTIEGCSYKPTSIYNCVYLGGGKVAAYVGIMELMGDNPYTARNSMAVIIDLNNHTIKQIKEVPYTDGHSIAIEYHNGEVYFSSYGVDKAGIFVYNPSTETVNQTVSLSGNLTYFHFFE